METLWSKLAGRAKGPNRNRRGFKALLLAFLAIGATFVVAGCGSSDSSETTVKLQDSTAPAQADIKNLDWALATGEPDTLDPPKAVNLSSSMVVGNLCDPLLRMNADFSLSPNLAKLSTPNDTTLVFDLVKDAKFWDGSPVTPEDVQYSLERLSDPMASYVAAIFSGVSSVKVTGPNQVTMKLDKPNTLIAEELGGAFTGIYKKSFAEKAGSGFGTPDGGIMCSGPFKLESWNAGTDIKLTRNDDYWNDEWRARSATADLKFLTDTTALAQALDAGELDGAYEVSPVITPKLQDSSAGRILFGPCDCFLTLNVARPDGPLADVSLRKALLKSIDRQALATGVYLDAAQPNYTLLAKSVWDKETKSQWEDAYGQYESENSFDVDAAKKLVDASDYSGEPIVLATLAGDEAQSKTAQLIQQQAKSIGLTVHIKPLQAIKYASIAVDPSARADIDLIMYASYNGYPDPQETLPLYVTPNVFNYTDYKNKQVDNLIAKARETTDASKRTDLLIQAQEIYEPEYVMQSLLSTPSIMFLKNGLTGATTSFAYLNQPSLAPIGAE